MNLLPKWQHICADELARISRFAVEPLRNYEEALQWYLSAATQGHEVAQYELGRCIQGIGVERDEVQAHRWFLQSAEQDIYMRTITPPVYSGSEYSTGPGKALISLPKQQKMGRWAGMRSYELGER
ncbi:tetratricopeptide repeat protein [Shigella sonnei]